MCENSRQIDFSKVAKFPLELGPKLENPRQSPVDNWRNQSERLVGPKNDEKYFQKSHENAKLPRNFGTRV